MYPATSGSGLGFHESVNVAACAASAQSSKRTARPQMRLAPWSKMHVTAERPIRGSSATSVPFELIRNKW